MRVSVICNALLGGGLAVLITGCAGPARYATLPHPPALEAEYSPVDQVADREQDDASGSPGATAAAEAGAREATRAVEAPEPLDLSRALELALMRNPQLAAVSHAVRATAARARQALLFNAWKTAMSCLSNMKTTLR